MFCYLYVVHLCFLGKDGGPVNAVEAGGQHSDDEEVEDDADQVDAALVLAGAVGNFLFDPLLLQVCLKRPERKSFTNQTCNQINKSRRLSTVLLWSRVEALTRSSYSKLLLFSLAAFSLVMQKSQPAKILLQKLWKRSSSWTRFRLKPVADLQERRVQI